MKITQTKRQIKSCADYANRLCRQCNAPVTGQLDIRPFEELKETIATVDVIEAIELDIAIRQLSDDYKFSYNHNGYGMIGPISLGRICGVLNILSKNMKT